MPQTGGPIKVKKVKPPKPPKPVAPRSGARGGRSGDVSEAEFHERPAPTPKPPKPIGRHSEDVRPRDFKAGSSSGSSANQVKGKRTVGGKGGKGNLKQDNPATGATSGPGTNKKKATFKQAFEMEKAGVAPPTIRKKHTGGIGDGGGGGSVGGRGGGGGGTVERRGGAPGRAQGGLPVSFRDRDLVGSSNIITEFDGSTYDSSSDTEIVGGGGGGTGSSLQGREAVGRVGDIEGQSLEEVVYGVQKRGRKVKRARSL